MVTVSVGGRVWPPTETVTYAGMVTVSVGDIGRLLRRRDRVQYSREHGLLSTHPPYTPGVHRCTPPAPAAPREEDGAQDAETTLPPLKWPLISFPMSRS